MPPDSLSSTDGAGRLTDEQIEAALLRLDADVRQRLRIFDGGPELLSWENAHRLHRDEPYIGCPFCQDQFVPLMEAEQQREALMVLAMACDDSLIPEAAECDKFFDRGLVRLVRGYGDEYETVVTPVGRDFLLKTFASLAAVAVEDDGPKFYGWDHPADEDEEAPSGRPVPAGEGADAGPQEEET